MGQPLQPGCNEDWENHDLDGQIDNLPELPGGRDMWLSQQVQGVPGLIVVPDRTRNSTTQAEGLEGAFPKGVLEPNALGDEKPVAPV